MFNLNEFLTNEYRNEYGNDYNSPMKKKYSEPKIYDAKGDLSKRWYVYYRFRNPETDQLQKMPSIYIGVNNFKTKEERLSMLISFQRNLSQLLKDGYNPFENNQVLYEKEIENISQLRSETTIEEPKLTIRKAFEFALNLKRNVLKDTSIRGLNNRMNNFLDWIDTNHPKLKSIDQLTKKIVTEFLNSVLTNTSARNRNNFRADLSSLIQMLEENEIITVNFIKNIPVLNSIPKRNKTYSDDMQQNIYTFLEKNDPFLLLYIKFIIYNLLRPIEICRLKIKDLNIKERKIQFQAKNSTLKTKIIPEILINDLPDLSKFDDEDYLFTPDQIGGKWDTKEINKRNYFSKRFKKVVKDHFGLDKDYGLYSFRHTVITRLYKELRKKYSPNEAKNNLMLITGHSTLSALEKYLRDIDAELPADYSDMLK
jgi:integrase